MRADNSRHIIAAAKRRGEYTRAKAIQALRTLDTQGEPVTFQSVAQQAGVSRSWLYAQPDLRGEIDRLRTAHRRAPASPVPTRQRGSDASLLRRLEAAQQHIRQLTEETGSCASTSPRPSGNSGWFTASAAGQDTLENMQDDRARLLQTPRQDLEAARRDRSTWTRLAFTAAYTGDGQVVDCNRAARFGVLWAAQYDRQAEDLPLLRFLFEQEIVRYREAVPLGLAPDLELAGLLVAEHRQLQDVWLHWQAKDINFDTALGYGTYYLLTAGVAATIAEVQARNHPDRDRMLREITTARNRDGTPRFTDAAVDEWLAGQRTQFPDDPDAEDLRTWANHAVRLGDGNASRRFIFQWADTQPRTEQTLNSLQFHLAGLGFLDEAIQVQTEAVAACGPGSGKASKLLTLVKLHRQAGNFAGAWQALRGCGEVMPTDPFWKDAGLWRYFVKEHFLLVPTAPDPDTGQHLLQEGDRQMRGVARLWMDGVLDAAINAAEHTGQSQLRDHYHRIQVDEHQARDQEIRQASGRPATTDKTSATE